MDDLSVFRKSDLLHFQEEMSRYRPGGYHPISTGDTLKNDRYEVRCKLGWGGFSTVWLAKDTKLEQWVSIKVMVANSLEHSRDLSIMGLLRQKRTSEYIVQLLDSFTHEGPNGTHGCLYFEMLGPTVDHVVNDCEMCKDCLEPEIILRITRQLLQAVASLHKVGIAHRDISGANMAFTCHMTRSPETEILRILGSPEPEGLARLDGGILGPALPTQLVRAATWEDWIEEDEEDVRLIDFGEAFLHGNPPPKLCQPYGLEAPETIFTSTFDYRVDLWRVGCTIYTLLFASMPFQSLGKIDAVVKQMINFVEELPKEWDWKWKNIKESAQNQYINLYSDNTGVSRLDEMFATKIRDPGLKALLPVMKGLMRFVPTARMEASDALQLLDSLLYSRPGSPEDVTTA